MVLPLVHELKDPLDAFIFIFQARGLASEETEGRPGHCGVVRRVKNPDSGAQVLSFMSQPCQLCGLRRVLNFPVPQFPCL